MSGIFGILNTDGEPIDQSIMTKMLHSLEAYGPHGQDQWINDNVGLGYTLLKTVDNPALTIGTLGQRYTIVANVRVDDRITLTNKLGCADEIELNDTDIILRAYARWGTKCLEHIIGAFVFAIWDEVDKNLFCACDQMGVRQLYYSYIDSTFLFSNSIDCLREHPSVSSTLNEYSIGDFLLFGTNRNPETTAFKDIQHLAPSHYLLFRDHTFNVEQYWSLPIKPQLQYRNIEEYVEHYKELLQLSVGDRLRVPSVGVFMSGGLDSTAIAALAKQELARTYSQFQLRAYTGIYKRIHPDEEEYYAQIAANHLDIPISFQKADNYAILERCDTSELRTPEPADFVLRALVYDISDMIAQSSINVMLDGQGADEILLSPSLASLLYTFQWTTAVRHLFGYYSRYGQISPLNSGLIQYIKFLITGIWLSHPYPEWINQDFAREYDLYGRWKEIEHQLIFRKHSYRPEAFYYLQPNMWQAYFTHRGPGSLNPGIEVRYPFLDTRLIEFGLRLPSKVLLESKLIERLAMQGMLPDSILSRNKTIIGNRLPAHLNNPKSKEYLKIPIKHLSSRYINNKKLPVLKGTNINNRLLWANLRPYVLFHWLNML